MSLISLYWLGSFVLFLNLQAWFINGVHATMSGVCTNDINKGEICSGLIFFPFARWLDKKIKYDWIKKPLWKCVRCMASFWGAITFFGVVIPVFGFEYWQLAVYVVDVFILVNLNLWVYKKL